MSSNNKDAVRFVKGILTNNKLSQEFKKKYNCTLAQVNAQLTKVHGNSLEYFQGDYSTQLSDGTAGPAVSIRTGSVTVSGAAITGFTFANGQLSWTNDTCSGQLAMSSLTGLTPESDPLSPQFSPSSLGQATAATVAVTNPYVGYQFVGFYWTQGQSKPTDPNLTGRLGKFPLANTAQSTQGPLEASQLSQWADTYHVNTPSPSGNGQYVESSTTLVIDTSGNVSVNGTAITSVEFKNSVLQWKASDGNATSAQLWMKDNSSAGSTGSPTGNQFWGYCWPSGTQAPTAANWFGSADSDTGSDAGSDSGSQNGSQGSSGSAQDLNGWAVVQSLGAQLIQLYVQMQMGEMIMKVGTKVLSVIWDGVKAVFTSVRDYARSLKENAPKDDDAKPKDGKDSKEKTEGGKEKGGKEKTEGGKEKGGKEKTEDGKGKGGEGKAEAGGDDSGGNAFGNTDVGGGLGGQGGKGSKGEPSGNDTGGSESQPQGLENPYQQNPDGAQVTQGQGKNDDPAKENGGGGEKKPSDVNGGEPTETTGEGIGGDLKKFGDDGFEKGLGGDGFPKSFGGSGDFDAPGLDGIGGTLDSALGSEGAGLLVDGLTFV